MIVTREPFAIVIFCVVAVFSSGCFGGDPPANTADAGHDAAVDADAGGDAMTDAVGDTRVAVGQPCHGPEDCVDGASCIGTGQPNEFICMHNCADPGRICADGSVCTPRLSPSEPICFTAGTTPRGERCENNLDCVPGTLCFGTEQERYCLDACHELDPNVCPAGTHCDTGSDGGKGLCRSDLGATCASTADCGDGLDCSTDFGSPLADALPGGYCTVEDCASDADCPDSGVCRTLPGASHPICLTTCAGDADCRFNQDYRCVDDRYCNNVDNPEGCEAFRDGENICFPVTLNANF